MVVGAGHLLGEPPLLREGLAVVVDVAGLDVDEVHDQDPAREPQRRLDGVRETPLAGAVVALGDEAVDHHLDGVLALLLQRRRLGQGHGLAVHPRAGEALGLQLGEQVHELALAALDHRREHLEARALGQGEQLVDDLLRALAADGLAAHGAVRVPGAGEQEPEVVVDLGDGPHRRARVAVGRLLVDRDRRGQSLDEVDVGLVHLAEELAGVGRQRLDVPTLALGEDGVEGEARLARPRQPGEDHQGVAGQVDRDVAEVVLARSSDDQAVVGAARGDRSIRHVRNARCHHRHTPSLTPRHLAPGDRALAGTSPPARLVLSV